MGSSPTPRRCGSSRVARSTIPSAAAGGSRRCARTKSATATALGAVEHGLGKLGLEKIIGLTFPEHRVSQRVLEKAGLTFVREAEWYGMAMREYQITA